MDGVKGVGSTSFRMTSQDQDAHIGQEPITLSALARPVHVGNLYNYHKYEILNSPYSVPRYFIEHKTTRQTEMRFDFQQSEKLKCHTAGITSHLAKSINDQRLDSDQLWFDNYLKADEDEAEANVTIFFRIDRWIETFRPSFIDRQIKEYQKKPENDATHLVTLVVYGVEIILSIRRSVDEQPKTKKKVEQSIYLAAKSYFDQFIASNWIMKCDPTPEELKNVTCTILYNLTFNKEMKGSSFRDATEFIREIIRFSNNEDNCRPIEIVLHQIPPLIKLSKLVSENKIDINVERKRNNELWKWTVNEYWEIFNHPYFRYFRPFEKVLMQFQQKLLDTLFKKTSKKLDEIRKSHAGDKKKELQYMKDYNSKVLSHIKDWLIRRRDEIETAHSLLEGTTLLPVMDLEDIVKDRKEIDQPQDAKVFVLKVDYIANPLVEVIQKFVDLNQENYFKLPVFLFKSSYLTRFEEIKSKLQAFAKQSNKDQNFSYVIGLSQADSRYHDGDTFIMNDNYSKPADTFKLDEKNELLTKLLKPDQTEQSDDVKSEKNDIPLSPPTQISRQVNKDQLLLRKDSLNDQVAFEKAEEKAEETKFDIVQLPTQPICQESDKEPPKVLAFKRVAEMFIEDSELLKNSQPKVYLLNAKGKFFGAELRWFEIGQQNKHKDHKTIILMGATGSGKSTLINGMINFILGVKWEDSFRFDCVRDDVTRNQAHSQTSSVTAYTIYHQEGMVVDYSLTLIDTPGYGDTRGVARDKEITKTIHRFLMQRDAQIDKIHAACFVAASSNSRLTVTQRYVLDSVLSIFGKDFRDNIRLLVTFADNADPPVVEACRVAHFPMTSTSEGITYSKFNSSVLYASTDQGSFDELFWDMGQENFQKFFKMLEGMNSKDLKSTREVIQQRQQLQQSLKGIESELEIYFVKIENIGIFLNRISVEDGNKKLNPNLVIEKTEMQKTQVACQKGFVAYNCLRCRQTCELRLENPESLDMMKKSCELPTCIKCPKEDHVYENSAWEIVPVKVKTTIGAMKGEYESNFKRKLEPEELIDKCVKELKQAKGNVINLLKQVGDTGRFLDSTALRSNALSPADYLSLMRSRVAEEQAPGYLSRLETLTELQQLIAEIESIDQTQTPSA